jgi:AcrR family transcriptional regulator
MVEDVAAELGISKGSVFQHFGSKAGLSSPPTAEASRRSPRGSAPDDVRAEGFWSVLVYWLERMEHLVQENWARIR